MQTQYPMKDFNVAYWTNLLACVLATSLFALFLGFGVAQASLALFLEPQTYALLLALAGMVMILWNNLLGGGLTLVGMAFFYGLNFMQAGQLPSGWVFPLCFLTGIVALVAGVLKFRT
jgi:hypothetical protein